MEDTEGEVTVRGQVGRVSKQGGKERKEHDHEESGTKTLVSKGHFPVG